MSKHKFIVLFLKNLNGSPLLVGHKSIDVKSSKISFKKKTYLLNTSFPSYTKKNKTYYLVDIVSGQISFRDVKGQDIISNEILDQIISKEVIRQMIEAVRPMGLMDKLLYLFMGVLGGVGIGIIVAGYL